jgi:6,7-dimethyl-8-ribityllumazine synthase
MTHLLILQATANGSVTNILLQSTLDVLTSNNCSFDEVHVPTIGELPITLNSLVESKPYDGAICIGFTYPKFESPIFLATYKEVLRSLIEFSTYYTFPVGLSLLYTETVKEALKVGDVFAQEIANSTIQIIQTMRQFTNLEENQYARNQKHN